MSTDVDVIVRDAIVASPLARLLGLALVSAEPDLVRVRLPYRAEVTTVGDLVHGGAVAALVDVAATAVAWTRADLARGPRGTTIGLTLSYLAPARGRDLVATATVIQRGSSIVVCEVTVADDAGTATTRALVTYKLTHG